MAIGPTPSPKSLVDAFNKNAETSTPSEITNLYLETMELLLANTNPEALESAMQLQHSYRMIVEHKKTSDKILSVVSTIFGGREKTIFTNLFRRLLEKATLEMQGATNLEQKTTILENFLKNQLFVIIQDAEMVEETCQLIEAGGNDLYPLYAILTKESLDLIPSIKPIIAANPLLLKAVRKYCDTLSLRLLSYQLNDEAQKLRSIEKQSFIDSNSVHEQQDFNEFLASHEKELSVSTNKAIEAHLLSDKAVRKLIEIGLNEAAFDLLELAAKKIPIPNAQDHPIYNLNEVFHQLQNREIDPEFGARFSGLDTGVLKNGVVCFRERNIDGRMRACIDFKISFVAREQLQKLVTAIQSQPDRFKSQITILEKSEYVFKFAGEDHVFSTSKGLSLPNNSLEIEFANIGRVIFGNDPKCLGVYNAISIELEEYEQPGAALQNLHRMTTLLGLGPIFQLQREEDEKRIKIGQLLKTYFPAVAYSLEHTQLFYDSSPDELIETISKTEPGMRAVFQKYLVEHPHLMQKEEIFPGEFIWTLTDLSAQLKENGALGFFAEMTGPMHGKQGMAALKQIVHCGILCSEERFRANRKTEGMSSRTDISRGAGSEVFSRLLTRDNISRHSMTGSAYFLIDLTIANLVTYGYPSDNYGSKAPTSLYSHRPNMIAFVKSRPSLENEHMSKKRVLPEKLRIVLPETLREQLLKELITDGDVQEKDGIFFIKIGDRWIPVEDYFPKKPSNFSPEMFQYNYENYSDSL